MDDGLSHAHYESLQQLRALVQVAHIALDHITDNPSPYPQSDELVYSLLESATQYAERELNKYGLLD